MTLAAASPPTVPVPQALPLPLGFGRTLEGEALGPRARARARAVTGHKAEAVYLGYDANGAELEREAQAEAIRLLWSRTQCSGDSPLSAPLPLDKNEALWPLESWATTTLEVGPLRK
jgi:hypothetical protein